MANLSETCMLDAAQLTTRELNSRIRELMIEGASHVTVANPAARHNLGVALSSELAITYQGPVGYFCGALGNGPRVEVEGSAGWSTGADLIDGVIHVRGNSGASTAASARGGLIAVDGDVGARTAIAMKGGTLLVGGNAGYMTGFLMQKGTVVVCGDAAEGFGDSMYLGTLYCGGKIAELGADTKISEPTDEELAWLRETLTEHELESDLPWRKITSAGRLWRFDKREFDAWRHAL
jgi:glutamate synthase domain-containing protein 3